MDVTLWADHFNLLNGFKNKKICYFIDFQFFLHYIQRCIICEFENTHQNDGSINPFYYF